MRKLRNLKRMLLTGSVVATTLLSLGLGAKVSAACVQYDPNATTPTTPVFNNICNVPQGVGNENDFVRVRQSTNGNNEDNQNNPLYTDGLTTACNAGDKFDVWTYIHNNAVSAYNNSGTGSAVAHNVALHMTAPVNTTSNKFTFLSSVSASNAAGVQDTATLACSNNKQVKLTLVPSTVHIYSQQYSWNNLTDAAVNGNTKIGSPTLGSGDQWGCWDYRVVVVYTVTVQDVPVVNPPTSLGECKVTEFNVDQKNRKVSVNAVTATLQNAQVIGHRIDWGDGTTSSQTTDSHTYSKDGSYTVNVSVQVKFADGHTEWKSAADCVKTVVFSTAPVTPATPTALPNTGPGDVVGIFAAVTIAGALLHRYVLGRRYQ